MDDAVDGVGGADRVQRGKDQMAGLGRGDGDADRLQVAHLADEDDVGVLAQGGAQRVGVALGVAADLALVDDGFLGVVEGLDGVLQRDDVVGVGLVDDVDERGQRGAFAAAGGAGDQHEAALFVHHLDDAVGDAQLLRLGNVQIEDAGDQRRGVALAKDVDAEAPDAEDGVGEIDLAVLLIGLHQILVHDRRGDAVDIVRL